MEIGQEGPRFASLSLGWGWTPAETHKLNLILAADSSIAAFTLNFNGTSGGRQSDILHLCVQKRTMRKRNRCVYDSAAGKRVGCVLR